MNNQIVLIGAGVLIAVVLVIVVVVLSRKKAENFTTGQGSAVLTADASGNIQVANSLALTSLDVDSGLTLNQSSGNIGNVIMSTGSGSNPTWQPGFIRFIGAFPTTFPGGSVAPNNTIISALLKNLIPGNTLLVKCIIDVFGGGFAKTQAQLGGGDNSLVFISPTNNASYTTIHFVGTIKNNNGGSSANLSLVNVGDITINLYNATSVIEVYEYSS